jgi:hypothetical protein
MLECGGGASLETAMTQLLGTLHVRDWGLE